MINQAGKPIQAHFPLLKGFENSSVTIDGARQDPTGLSGKDSLLFGPFIKRLGSVTLPDDLDEYKIRNKQIKVELTTRPSFRAPTLTDSYYADTNNDQKVESENAEIEQLTMTAEVDCQKLLKDTPQGQHFLIHKSSSLRHFSCNDDSMETKWKEMAKFGLKNQGTGHFFQLKV